MLIECLTVREGISEFWLDQFKYTFMPIQPGKPSTSIADVASEEHIDYLLKRGNFRQYIPNRKEDNSPLGAGPNPLAGFSIEKCGESGYMAVDRRDKDHKFAGQDASWKSSPAGMKPFSSQMDAWEWLKEETMDMAENEVQEEKKAPPKKASKVLEKVLSSD